MKKLSIILAFLLIFVACSSKKETSEKKVYKIGTDVIFAPFEFEKDGKYVGIDIEILDAIAKAEGFEYTLSPMNFNGLIPAISSDQLDGAIAGMTITDERKEVLDFSEAALKLENTELIIEEGGNHSFEDIERYFRKISTFFR